MKVHRMVWKCKKGQSVMNKKKLIKENEDLKKRLNFFIMLTEVNAVTIPEALYKKYACVTKSDGSIHELFPKAEFRRWDNNQEFMQLQEMGAKNGKQF